MSHYNTSEQSLIKILKEITNNKKGKFFKPTDTFDPAWGSLFSLLFVGPQRGFNGANNWPELIKIASLVEYHEYLRGGEGVKSFLNKWSEHSLIQVWTPFLERGFHSLQNSIDGWLNFDSLKIFDDTISIEVKEKLINNIKEILREIFMIFGEINSNSTYHGLNSETNLANRSLITGFIKGNKDGSWDVFHADVGMTIVKNIKTKSKDEIITKTNKEILAWAMKFGKSSKSEIDFPIRGGGMGVLKQIVIENGNSVICISGDYKIEFELNEEVDDKGDAENIDELVSAKITKNDFRFGGTLWLIHMNKTGRSGKASSKEENEHKINENIMKKKKREELIDEFLKEKEYIL